MRANIEHTLIAIIEHKALFFMVIDDADKQHQGDEGLSRQLYNQELHKLLLALPNENDRQALDAKLSLKNLKANKLIDIEERANKFYLQPFLIEMIRQLDNIRIKHLTSAELEGLRQELMQLEERARNASFQWVEGDIDFDEFKRHVHTLIHGVYTQIQRNVESLKGRSKELNEVLLQQDVHNMDFYDQQAETLKRVRKIYDRNVIPTLQFLDERHNVKGLTAVESIQRIIDRFSDANMNTHAFRLQVLKAKLMQNATEVSDIRQTLEHYTLLERDMRKFFDRVEHRREALRQAVNEKKTGRKNKKITLTSNPELFAASTCIAGIKRRNANLNPLDLAIQNGRIYLDEFKRTQPSLTEQFDEAEFKTYKDIDRENPDFHHAMHQLQRLLNVMPNIQAGQDIIRTIHDFLSMKWSRYELAFVWEAMPLLSELKNSKIAGKTTMTSITHNGYILHYYPRYVVEESTE